MVKWYSDDNADWFKNVIADEKRQQVAAMEEAGVTPGGDISISKSATKRTRDDASIEPVPDSTKATKKLRGSTMDTDVVMTEAAAAKSSGTGQAQGGGKNETSISPFPRIDYRFFTETCTVSLPLVVYFSANDCNKVDPVVLRFKCNTPYNIFTDNTLVAQTIASNKTKGLSNCNSQNLSLANFATFVTGNQFPCNIVGATAKTATTTSSGAITDSAVRPARRSAYEKIYDAYTVLETRWRLDIEFSSDENTAKGIVFHEYDTVTSSSTSDKMPTNRSVMYYKSWPKVKSLTFDRQSGNNHLMPWRKSISGVWRPNSLHKNTKNEEDIKTWTATGSPPTNSWVEDAVFLFMQDDYSSGYQENSYNIKVSLEYIVQYKDLKNTLRYPHSTDATINCISYPGDAIQVPNTQEAVP